jgi:hypothetical protein
VSLRTIATKPSGRSAYTDYTYSFDKFCPAPTASPAGQSNINNSIQVTLSCSDPTAVIKYTLDGTDPTSNNGTQVSNPYNLTITGNNQTKNLRMVAKDTLNNYSTPVSSYNFQFLVSNGGGGSEPCFEKYSTKILCYDPKTKSESYVPIYTLKPGMFVKTHLHGYRPIKHIRNGSFENDPRDLTRCMYKLQKDIYEGATSDLIVTGDHSILLDSEDYQVSALPGNPDQRIDDKRLVLAHYCKIFQQIQTNQKFEYYHLSLESSDPKQRFGIWANGILTETVSNWFISE